MEVQEIDNTYLQPPTSLCQDLKAEEAHFLIGLMLANEEKMYAAIASRKNFSDDLQVKDGF